MLIDSHCHLDLLDLTPYQGDLTAVIAAARARGVTHFLCVCIELTNLSDILHITREHAGVFASVGVHPSTDQHVGVTEAELIKHANDPMVIAIGETGLDYHYPGPDFASQQDRFRQHIRAARQTQKPLIIHTRDAREDTLRIMREENASEIGGVMHCFTESVEMAKAAIDLNFYISFSGIITFKNAEALRETARQIPLERVLIETDAPYLAPVPYRGKSNVPAYVYEVAQAFAELRGLSLEEVGKITTHNFYQCFRLPTALR